MIWLRGISFSWRTRPKSAKGVSAAMVNRRAFVNQYEDRHTEARQSWTVGAQAEAPRGETRSLKMPSELRGNNP